MRKLKSIARAAREELRQFRAPSETDFQHSRLSTQTGTAFIRVLDLQDERSPNGLLQCRLHDVDLNAEPAPQYHAVSYSWRKDVLRGQVHHVLAQLAPERFPQYTVHNQEAGSRMILCNGSALRIQRNLHDFLSRLRQTSGRLSLWIDAICIDQDEENEEARNEKYAQLRLMGRIYESAQVVLVWLGESGNISSSLPQMLRSLQPLQQPYENFRVENDMIEIGTKPNPMQLLLRMTGIDMESSWGVAAVAMYKRLSPMNGLLRLVNRDYFQRAWVMQEMALARNLRFLIGELEITSDELLMGVHCMLNVQKTPFMMMHVPSDKGGFAAVPHILQARVDRLAGNSWSFDDFLFLNRDRQASRPEDKVISILGMADEEAVAAVYEGAKTVDGSIDLAKLYANTALVVTEARGWPYLLSLIACGAAETQDLPSWVPDLRVPLQPKPFWYFGGTHYLAATSEPASFTASSVLTPKSSLPSLILSGLCLDEVIQVSESGAELEMVHKFSLEGHFLDLVTKLGRHYAGSDELTLDAVLHTLTADIFSRPSDVASKPTLAELRRSFLSWLEMTFEPWNTTSTGSRALKMSGKIMSRALNSPFDANNTAASINGVHISMDNLLLDAFIATHQSEAFPALASILERPPPPPSPVQDFGQSEGEQSNVQYLGQKADRISTRPDTGEGENKEMEPREIYYLFPNSEDAAPASDASSDVLDEQISEHGFTPALLVPLMNKLFDPTMTAINRLYEHRRLFRTKNRNLVGLGPEDLRKGDVVCLIAGVGTPFLARRLQRLAGEDENQEQVKLVGSAYLHGAMDGAMINPDGWKEMIVV